MLELGAHLAATPIREPALRAKRLAWVAEQLCSLHGVELIVRGARVPTGPAVVVANHLSYIDPLAIVSLVPSIPIAKIEVRGWPLIGELMSQLGVLFVRREDPYSGAQVLRESIRMVEAGLPILAFPEGTTTTGNMLPFRRGVFGVAKHTGVPIVPIALRYESEAPCWVGNDPFLPHYLRTTARSRTRLEVTIMPPLDPGPWTRAESIALEAHAQIRAALLDG